MAAINLGGKSAFPRAGSLVALNFSGVGDFQWRNGGPDYGLLTSQGCRAGDRIICEVNGQLFDCGPTDWFGTPLVMAETREWGCKWWRLPCA